MAKKPAPGTKAFGRRAAARKSKLPKLPKHLQPDRQNVPVAPGTSVRGKEGAADAHQIQSRLETERAMGLRRGGK